MLFDLTLTRTTCCVYICDIYSAFTAVKNIKDVTKGNYENSNAYLKVYGSTHTHTKGKNARRLVAFACLYRIYFFFCKKFVFRARIVTLCGPKSTTTTAASKVRTLTMGITFFLFCSTLMIHIHTSASYCHLNSIIFIVYKKNFCVCVLLSARVNFLRQCVPSEWEAKEEWILLSSHARTIIHLYSHSRSCHWRLFFT